MKDHAWQLSSLELSKKLKELGIKQESLWWWVESINSKQAVLCIKIQDTFWTLSGRRIENAFLIRNGWSKYSAFTVAELGEMLKNKGMGTTAYSNIFRHWWISGGEWIVEKQAYTHTEEADIEANARAKMLIYLKEKDK